MSRARSTAVRLVAAAVLVCIAGGIAFVAVEALRIPTLAPAPELDAVDLSGLQQPPRSEALVELMAEEARVASTTEQELLDDATQSLFEGRWLSSPDRARSGLGARESFARRLVDALRQPGCVDEPATNAAEEDASFRSGLAIREAARTFAATAVARAQLGEGRDGAEDLAAFVDALLSYRARCPHGVVVTKLLQESVDWLHKAAGHLLAVPDLPSSAQQELGRLLVAVETEPPRPANMVRREWALLQARHASQPSTANGRADVDEALAMLRRAFSRLLWLAEQPDGAEAVFRPTPEEQFVERLADAPRWLISLRLAEGTVVGLMMGSAELTLLRPQLGQLRVMRCHWAVRRARWIHGIEHAGRQAPSSLRSPAPRNPVTGALIMPSDPATLSCSPPSEEPGNEGPDEAIGLPEPPPR